MKKYLETAKSYVSYAPLLVAPVFAQDDIINLAPTGPFADLQNLTIPGLISTAISFLFIIAAVVFFFVLVIGGIRWITSGGDKANTEAARGQITSGLIGLVIVFSAWAIVTLLETFFGIAIFKSGIPIPTPTS